MITRALILAILAPLLVVPALAQQPAPKKKPPATAQKTGGRTNLGKFEDWVALGDKEAGEPVCYAFSTAQGSNPEQKNRGRVVLTVAQRPGLRDVVVFEAGFNFAADANVTVVADQTPLQFYTHQSRQRSAFARDGHAAVTAFQAAGRAIAHSLGPRGVKVADSFSLKGFSAAYAAISKACPPK